MEGADALHDNEAGNSGAEVIHLPAAQTYLRSPMTILLPAPGLTVEESRQAIDQTMRDLGALPTLWADAAVPGPGQPEQEAAEVGGDTALTGFGEVENQPTSYQIQPEQTASSSPPLFSS